MRSVVLVRGWTFLMGNTRPERFLRGLKFSDKKIRGLKFLGENLRDNENRSGVSN